MMGSGLGSERIINFVLRARSARTLVLLGGLSILFVGGPSRAAPEGPFKGFAGAWAGEGSIDMSSGATERLRCRSTDSVGGAGDTLNMDLDCKSDTYAFNLKVNATSDGGRIVGAWNEVTRGIQGGIEGQAANGKIRATVRGQGFTAAVAVTTRGSQQSVTIRSEGQQLSAVSITLHRAR
jgi:hypothetical protein